MGKQKGGGGERGGGGARGGRGRGEAATASDAAGGAGVRGSVGWAASLARTHEAIEAAIAPALGSADPWGRAVGGSAAGGVRVREFCFDPEPAVARVAIHRWTGVQRPSRHAAGDRVRLAQRLARSPHTAVRSAAHVELQLHDPLATIAGGEDTIKPPDRCRFRRFSCASNDPQ